MQTSVEAHLSDRQGGSLENRYERGNLQARLQLVAAEQDGGFARNLRASENVEQVVAVEDIFKRRHVNVITRSYYLTLSFADLKKAAVDGGYGVCRSVRRSESPLDLDAISACGQLQNDFQKVPVPAV
ncbi:hypothetical protein R1flu_020885 [Riccia fluitans]|uniref:Uncharacterized protein n=1 Tax=Riccia fluitans TaxID=41844 RepID=A0ABD1ZMS4_9MARC